MFDLIQNGIIARTAVSDADGFVHLGFERLPPMALIVGTDGTALR